MLGLNEKKLIFLNTSSLFEITNFTEEEEEKWGPFYQQISFYFFPCLVRSTLMKRNIPNILCLGCRMMVRKVFFLIHSAKPKSRPEVIIISTPVVRPPVHTFHNLSKQYKQDWGLAKWIIHDSCFFLSFAFLSNVVWEKGITLRNSFANGSKNLGGLEAAREVDVNKRTVTTYFNSLLYLAII